MPEVKYYVIGGEYTSTQFEKLVEGTGEVYGPYNKEQADKEWWSLTSKSVDNCMIRYNVVTGDHLVEAII